MKQREWDPIGFFLNGFCVLAAIFILLPVVIVIINSFNAASYTVFPLEGLSLKWYEKLITMTKFISGAKNSIIVGLVAVTIALLTGVPASFVLARYKFKGKNLIHALLLLPLAMPKIVLGLSLFILFVEIKIYGTLFGLGLAHSLLVLPYVIVMVTTAIKGIPKAQEEAAMDLGARPATAFLKVLFPQISTAMLLSATLGFVVSFDQVEASIFLVRSKQYTLPLEMMVYMEKYQDPVMAALSTVLITAVVLFCGIMFLWTRNKNIPFIKNLR